MDTTSLYVALDTGWLEKNKPISLSTSYQDFDILGLLF